MTLDTMTSKFLVLLLVIGFANTCVVRAQVAVPAQLPPESPSSAKKHRQPKSAETTATPAETGPSSVTADSPAISPMPRRPRKKTQPETTATPSATPTPSRRFRLRLPSLFKSKRSASPSPSAAKGE